MTILRVGSNEQYANNWNEAFGTKSTKTTTRAAGKKTSVKKKTAKKKAVKRKTKR